MIYWIILSIYYTLVISLKDYSVTCNYIGCYNSSQFPSQHDPFYSDSNMTVALCTESCRKSGFTFSVLHDHTTCSCYNDDGFIASLKLSKINDDICNISCNNNLDTSCGGKHGSSVYAVCPPGFYGNTYQPCGLQCPGHCASTDRAISKSCHIYTGECVDKCEKNWSGKKCLVNEQCDCVTGIINTNLTNSQNGLVNTSTTLVRNLTENKILLFPFLAFQRKGMVSKIRYLAEMNGTVFVSIWNVLRREQGGSVTSEVISAEYCGKIQVKVSAGLHTYQVPDNEKIVTDTGYCVGVHYPRNTNQAVIPLMLSPSDIKADSHLFSAQYTNSWFKVGSSHTFTVDKDTVFASPPSSVQIALQVFAHCDTGCQFNTYGQLCDKQCGHCRGNISCHQSSGVCPNKCDLGWTGELCNQKMMSTLIPNTKTNVTKGQNQTWWGVSNATTSTKGPEYPVDDSINLTIGLSIGVVLTFILLVLAVVGFSRCEFRKHDRTFYNSGQYNGRKSPSERDRKRSKRTRREQRKSPQQRHRNYSQTSYP